MPVPAQPSNALPIPAKLFFSRREIVSLTGLSLRFVDSLIANGVIRAKRVGDRVLIPRLPVERDTGDRPIPKRQCVALLPSPYTNPCFP
jgi:excisionase family DNA binding protein